MLVDFLGQQVRCWRSSDDGCSPSEHLPMCGRAKEAQGRKKSDRDAPCAHVSLAARHGLQSTSVGLKLEVSQLEICF